MECRQFDGSSSQFAVFFFADNATTPVVSIEAAFASENYLLQYMFCKDFPTNPAAPYAKPLSTWPYAGRHEVTANITAEGYVFAPLGKDIQQRCAFIKALIEDPANGV